jgi:hypothetical protein
MQFASARDEDNLKYILDKIGNSTLSGDIKIRATYRLQETVKGRGGVCRARDVDSMIAWRNTPEGHDFWSEINDEIGYEDGCRPWTDFDEDDDEEDF